MTVTAQDAARDYLERGWVPLRYARGTKGPTGPGAKGWQQTKPEDVDPAAFNGDNTGLLLGLPSGGLVDVDIDVPEALQLADEFLPPTGMVHGRKSKPRSHRWYVVPEDIPRTERVQAPDGSTLVELRGTGGQTMVPPSLHPDGEDVRWETQRLEPAQVHVDDLQRAVRRLAAASLLLRHWPAKGGRHDAALALAGALARGGWNIDDAMHFVGAVARAGGDDAHRADVRSTFERCIVNGRPATGIPSLAKIVGKPVADRVAALIGLRRRGAAGDKDQGSRRSTLVEIIDAIAADTAGALDGHPLSLNEMTGAVEHGGRPITDAWLTGLRQEFERKAQMLCPAEETHRAVEFVATQKPRHPVRDYLAGLVWDRTSRLGALRQALAAEDTPLVGDVLQAFLVSAVARALSPGCKVDTMLVLIGAQGCGKSRTLRALAGEWFSDSAITVGTKDAYTQLRQAWIHEWAELETLRRARDMEAIKSFLSSGIDIYRPSYGRLDLRVPRSSVFVGTTNHREFLADETGGRRFWPVVVGQIDVGAIAAMRDQLWAEAVTLHRAGRAWHLSAQREHELRLLHKEHEIRDAWEGPIEEWLAPPTRTEVTGAEILEIALKKPTGLWTPADARRVSAIMRRLGWSRGKKHGAAWRRGGEDGPSSIFPSSSPGDVHLPQDPSGGPNFGEDECSRGRSGKMDFSHLPPSSPDGERTRGEDGEDRKSCEGWKDESSATGGGAGSNTHVGVDQAESSSPSSPEAARAASDSPWRPGVPAGASGWPTGAQLAEAERHGWVWHDRAWVEALAYLDEAGVSLALSGGTLERYGRPTDDARTAEISSFINEHEVAIRAALERARGRGR